MAELIASGTSAANSADITVAAGTPTTVHINSAVDGLPPADAKVKVQVKSANGAVYTTVGELTRERPALVIDGPGLYRCRREVCSTAIAVNQD